MYSRYHVVSCQNRSGSKVRLRRYFEPAQLPKIAMKNNGKLAFPGKDSGESYERVGQWNLTPARRNDSWESPPSMRKIYQSRLHSKTTYFEFSTDVLSVASDLSNVPKDGFFLATPSEIEAERSAGQRSKQQELIGGAKDPVQTGFVPICDHDDHDNHHLFFLCPATRFHLKPTTSTPSAGWLG
jgi:hypothetical protein